MQIWRFYLVLLFFVEKKEELLDKSPFFQQIKLKLAVIATLNSNAYYH